MRYVTAHSTQPSGPDPHLSSFVSLDMESLCRERWELPAPPQARETVMLMVFVFFTVRSCLKPHREDFRSEWVLVCSTDLYEKLEMLLVSCIRGSVKLLLKDEGPSVLMLLSDDVPLRRKLRGGCGLGVKFSGHLSK